jgi:hypothetical protein
VVRAALVTLVASLFALPIGCAADARKVVPPAPAAVPRAPAPATPAEPPAWKPSYPAPPMQSSAWAPPATSLPPATVDATTTLFALGLADPRGCEYREVTLAVGNVWSGGGDAQPVHGWVLPRTGSTTYVVAWNGLVYRALSVGAR